MTEPSLVVRGHGEVEVVPDALRLELAVETTAVGVAAALSAARSTMAALRAAVAEAGPSGPDLRTSGLNVWQRFDGDKHVGYVASESLTVLVRDVDTVDHVLEAATNAAGDGLRVQGLAFAVTDSTEAMDAARREALAEATRVAKLYASAVGRELGAVLHLTEGGGHDTQPVFSRVKALSAAAGVERGTQTIAADVIVEWAFA